MPWVSDGTEGKPTEACKRCPLYCRPPRPLAFTEVPNPQALVITDYPTAGDLLRGQLLSRRIGKRLKRELAERGIERINVASRIACVPPTKKRTDSLMGKACKVCTAAPTFAVAHAGLPMLVLGKHAAAGILGTQEVPLRSGASVRLPVAKLARYLPICVADHNIVMTADSPAYSYWGKPSIQVPYNAALDRFAWAVAGRTPLPPPPTPIIWPGDDMLAILRTMGPEIGWDVETLGADPLTAPITCVGISDGIKTVSVPWDNYDTARQGSVHGVATSVRGLNYKIQQEVLRVLESDRIQVTQNGSYDVLAMSHRDLPGRNDWDIMHAYAVLWPENPKSLEAIALHLVPELDRRWKTIFRAGRDDDAKGSDVYAESPEEDLRDYNGMDAWATIKAKKPLADLLATED